MAEDTVIEAVTNASGNRVTADGNIMSAEDVTAQDKVIADNKIATEAKEKEGADAKAKEEKAALDKKSEEERKQKDADDKKEVLKTDLTLPKDSKLDEARVDKVLSFAKEHNLSKNVAQAILEEQSREADAQTEAMATTLESAQTKWREESEGHEVIGGEKLKEVAIQVKKISDRFFTPGLKKLMDETKYGDHPEFLHSMWNIAKSMTPEQLIVAGAGNNNSGQKKSAAEVLYGGSS